MKKLSLALITGGALCAFGVLLGGAALAVTGFEFSKVVTTMKYENKTAAYEPSLLAGIEIAAEDLKVVVSPSPDEQVHLSYWESALDATTIEVDGGMLRFRHTVSDSWLDNFIHGFWSSFARYRHVIEIKIPASFAGSLSVTNENAALEASGLTALSSAAFRSKNGALELTDILCLGGLTAETTNAPLSLDRVRGGTARITNANARIRVSDTQLLDTVLQTDNGSVLLHNLTVRSLTAKNKNASLEAEALAAVGRVELETTNASLTAIDVQSAGDYPSDPKMAVCVRQTAAHRRFSPEPPTPKSIWPAARPRRSRRKPPTGRWKSTGWIPATSPSSLLTAASGAASSDRKPTTSSPH